MKSKRTKPPAQLAKETAEKEQEKKRAMLEVSRKAGIATAFHFQRIIKHALQCTMPEAEKHFADAVQSGRIKEVGVNKGGDVKFYKIK